MSTVASVSFHFYKYLIKTFLPFEAKYVSLRGKKDNDIIEKLIEFYFTYIQRNYNIKITESSFQQDYQKILDNIFSRALSGYIQMLLQMISQEHIQLDQRSKDELTILLKKGMYWDAIEKLENNLEIRRRLDANHNSLSSVADLIDHTIYQKEFNTLKQYLNSFQRSFLILRKRLMTQSQDSSNRFNELEYLYFIVCHEFLNYLSHYSTAIVFFDSPRVFTTNLHRAIGHLKRALMDIYDGLIVEEKIANHPDYLSLRVAKVGSLGQSNKLSSLVIELETFYQNHSKFYKTHFIK